MVQSPDANGALSVSIFEDHPPLNTPPVAAEFTKTFRERATKAGLPETNVEVQAAASFTAWQMLEAAVNGTRSLDDKAIAAWLKANKVDTIQGKLRFDGPNNYGDDLMHVKQVQNGRWLIVASRRGRLPG
jgi:branched-chain amino acid transport system substrate-binding protein